jgi:hypothetical protein
MHIKRMVFGAFFQAKLPHPKSCHQLLWLHETDYTVTKLYFERIMFTNEMFLFFSFSLVNYTYNNLANILEMDIDVK